MSNITIKVEFNAGTALADALLEAKNKAKLWDVAFVEFEFNRTTFLIGRNADIDEALALGINIKNGYFSRSTVCLA